MYSATGRLPGPTPLSAVVTDAVRRWYQEAESDTNKGDVVSIMKSKSLRFGLREIAACQGALPGRSAVGHCLAFLLLQVRWSLRLT